MQVTVGRVGRPHGIRGDVVVGVRTDDPDLRFAVGSRLDTDRADVSSLTVAAMRWQSGALIVRFAGVRDRDAAALLRGTWLSVDSGTLAELDDPDEFRDHDLVGLSVRTADGRVVGVVADVLHHGQDLLAIQPLAGSDAPDAPDAAGAAVGGTPGEILVPFVKAIVTEVDVVAGVVVIDPPPGLLNPEEAR
ncbi:ribosome maturation factor RimM [Trebonia sp.]|uniref:ribosome maturation factor RimM n=1 Tax=Trebonia sp. TaxID=2767075 RepID=UPI00260D2A32|nr:ribosome maturation factor RimM [Trebonia sp.]